MKSVGQWELGAKQATCSKKPPGAKQATSNFANHRRLFTDSDEIRILKTYYKFTKSTTQSSTTPFASSSSPITVDSQTFERINKAVNSKFTQSQILDKLRKLRAKYRKQARTKSLIKTPHDQEIFNIARNMWGKKTKPKEKKVEDPVSSDDNNFNEEAEEEEEEEEAVVTGNEQRREEVNLEEYPVLVSEFSKYIPVNPMWKLLGNSKLKKMNEQWMSIGIEEAKIVTKKADLVKEQTQLLMQVLQTDNEDKEEGKEEEEEAAVTVNEQGRDQEVNLEEYPILVSEFSKYFPVNPMWKLLCNSKLRKMNEQCMSIGIEEAKIVTKKADLVKESRLNCSRMVHGSGELKNLVSISFC
ncbi:hypothetical protein EZV62_002340 [Acer yangbiense]|uniref:Glabrous enhancer-binding protein-like DBD domain-containing protein n=1 Tax=Acer yangbiense TaxID=1000413 RepID=A0A5C7IWU1_9ROSI|nr:hypothetical protein EZV62_002340 [Acer yangbiense]